MLNDVVMHGCMECPVWTIRNDGDMFCVAESYTEESETRTYFSSFDSARSFAREQFFRNGGRIYNMADPDPDSAFAQGRE